MSWEPYYSINQENQLANHQKNSTELTVSADNDSFVTSSGEAIYLPECITKESEKTELRNLVHSARHHMHALQTSAAKICSDMARARQLFGENHSKFFMQYALANFFAKDENGEVVSSVSRRRRVDDWVQKGKLINDYFEKSGNEDINRFSGLTMAALNSLCKAPEDVVKDVLDNPQGVKAIEIDERVALVKESAAEVNAELQTLKLELERVKDEAQNKLSQYEQALSDQRKRIIALDDSQDISNRQLNDSGEQLLFARGELEKLQKEVARLKSTGASASAVRAAVQKVDKTAEEERQLEQEIKHLRIEAEALKSKVGSMKDQVAVRESVANTVAQLKGDMQSMLAKYPAALRMKMQQVDPKTSALLDSIASDLHALADQLKPSSGVNPHNKVMPVSAAELSAADVMEV